MINLGVKTISLCMIVKNEEKYLEACLKSVNKKVNEIIIVDTGSQDQTINIAKENGAKVFSIKWNNDFAEARNFSIKQASMDYILVMDADEYLDENVDLQKVLSSEKDHYSIRIKNELSSGGSIFHPAVRLFKNFIGLQYFGKIHEHLNVDRPTSELSHEFGDVLIHHIGYKDDVVIEKEKHNRNMKILLDEVGSNPTGYNLYNLGNQYKANEQHNEALEAYKKAFPLSKDRLYINYLLYNMVDCLRILGRTKEALDVLDASIESFPNQTDFYFMRGRIYEEMYYYKDAEISYKKCVELGEVKLLQTLDGVGSYLSYIRLGHIYIELGDYSSALDMATAALKTNRYHMPALKMYLELLIRTNVPNVKIKESIKEIFPIASFEDLKHLVIVLSVIKSPLLQEFLDQYNLKVSESVLGISKLYSKNYMESYRIWKGNGLESDEYKDVLLLSFLLKNNDLEDKYKSSLNLSKKEWKLVDKLIYRDKVDFGKISEELEDIIVFISEQLIYLYEDEHFNYIFNVIAKGTSSLKIKFSKMLMETGFTQNAQQLLLDFYVENQTNKEYVELLADTCYKQKQFNEAISFYNRVTELSKDYLSYEKMFRTFEKLNDQKALEFLNEEIKRLFPLALWVK